MASDAELPTHSPAELRLNLIGPIETSIELPDPNPLSFTSPSRVRGGLARATAIRKALGDLDVVVVPSGAGTVLVTRHLSHELLHELTHRLFWHSAAAAPTGHPALEPIALAAAQPAKERWPICGPVVGGAAAALGVAPTRSGLEPAPLVRAELDASNVATAVASWTGVASLTTRSLTHLSDYLTALRRLLDGLVAVLRRMLVALLVALNGAIGVPFFLLLMIAVCRRYGHRGEPAHASSCPSTSRWRG